MTKRIFRSICVVVVSVLIATVILFLFILYSRFTDTQVEQLKMQATMAAQGINVSGKKYFTGLNTDNYRITWVSAGGSVLYDSESDSASMENHLDREEIQEAFSSGFGESKRYSSTMMERMLYYAERLNNGSVVRLSITQNTVLTLLIGLINPIIIILILALLLSIFLATRLSKSIVNPLNNINLDEPLENEGYDELSPLLHRIDSQQKQLKHNAENLQKKQNELDTVIGSMDEGIILLNAKNNIISINPSAAHLLEVEHVSCGANILTVCRNLIVQEALEQAHNNKHVEKVLNLHGGHYRLEANPIFAGKQHTIRAESSSSAPSSQVSGVALLFTDITEKENAEQMRREFTANVSHELKTPLHSIMGYTELMVNGIIKEEDYSSCFNKIHIEAKRMVQLIEDIINLSHLDEGAQDMQFEETDVFALATDIVSNLESAATAADVSISFDGEPSVVSGIPQLLSAIIYNLCDNAIKYNRKGGKINVSVTNVGNNDIGNITNINDSEVVISVSDTGIGIPHEHQHRIFERFYRVDKSHSKEVGGTGLGLSIVKHAVRIHDAKIELHSTLGKGTTITVRLPKRQHK